MTFEKEMIVNSEKEFAEKQAIEAKIINDFA